MVGYGFSNYTTLEICKKIGADRSNVDEYKAAVLAMYEWLYNSHEKPFLGGKNKIVEIDEALLGKKHGFLAHGNNSKILKY